MRVNYEKQTHFMALFCGTSLYGESTPPKEMLGASVHRSQSLAKELTQLINMPGVGFLARSAKRNSLGNTDLRMGGIRYPVKRLITKLGMSVRTSELLPLLTKEGAGGRLNRHNGITEYCISITCRELLRGGAPEN